MTNLTLDRCAPSMSSGKKNEWLDADQSGEDDDLSYGSGAEEDSKGAAFRARPAKRLKVDRHFDEDSVASEDEYRTTAGNRLNLLSPRGHLDVDGIASENEQDNISSHHDLPALPQSQGPAALASKKLEASRNKVKKTGVIYLTRVPPFMKPATVKHLLQPYGEIGRIFLTPEDSVAHTRRIKAGGNKKRSFIDGWVEFLSKKDAKIVAETLNATIIGGKKGGWYHDDVWNIRYLKGFKWHHLTEQIANENAERAARLRVEIAQTTRENKAFLENVERAKMLEGMNAKKNRKRKGLEHEALEDNADTSDRPRLGDSKTFRREFKQNDVLRKSLEHNQQEEQPEDVKRVLSKIF